MRNSSKHRDTDGFRDMNGPVGRHLDSTIPPPRIRYDGGYRDGPRIHGRDVGLWILTTKWAHNTEVPLMNVVEQLKENYDEAEKLWAGYAERLTKFRSEVKNDVASLEASTRKTTEAVQRMVTAYGKVIETLNGPEFLKAVENAERLAVALSSLANLQPHKLTLAVVDQTKPAD